MNLLYAIAFSAGILNGAMAQYEPIIITEIDNPIYVDIDADVQYGPFFVTCNIRTDTWLLPEASFYPWQSTYEIGAGFRWKDLEVGLSHVCFHPMQPYQWLTYQVVPSWEGSVTTVYIKLTLTNRR
jgi:hypothetical protein